MRRAAYWKRLSRGGAMRFHARHELEREETPHYESHATFDAVERSFDEPPKRDGLDDGFGLSLRK
jgi:hypothetical protein